MTITIYPDGHSIQQGTPEELARPVFEMQALQTLFDKHTDHVYCCRCGYKMEGLEYERKTAG